MPGHRVGNRGHRAHPSRSTRATSGPDPDWSGSKPCCSCGTRGLNSTQSGSQCTCGCRNSRTRFAGSAIRFASIDGNALSGPAVVQSGRVEGDAEEMLAAREIEQEHLFPRDVKPAAKFTGDLFVVGVGYGNEGGEPQRAIEMRADHRRLRPRPVERRSQKLRKVSLGSRTPMFAVYGSGSVGCRSARRTREAEAGGALDGARLDGRGQRAPAGRAHDQIQILEREPVSVCRRRGLSRTRHHHPVAAGDQSEGVDGAGERERRGAGAAGQIPEIALLTAADSRAHRCRRARCETAAAAAAADGRRTTIARLSRTRSRFSRPAEPADRRAPRGGH